MSPPPVRDARAVTIVIAGEDYFRGTVIPNVKWNAVGGARLEPFFVNGCLHHFAASVRSRRKEHPQWTTPGTEMADEETADVHGVLADLVSATRLNYRVARRDRRWGIVSLDAVCEHETLTAAVPGMTLAAGC
jgi:hypothetical protein